MGSRVDGKLIEIICVENHKPDRTWTVVLCMKFNHFILFCRPKVEKQYSRDVFIFLFALLIIASVVFTLKKNDDKLLNRDQTEEWKGWMQVRPSLCVRCAGVSWGDTRVLVGL